MINSIEDLQKLVAAGVRDFKEYGHVRVFEYNGMIGFDYTQEAEFEAKWTYFERISRGLVLDAVTGEVLARPYDKFFNIGQHNAYPESPISCVLEKADGSLGIIFRDQHEDIRCNTRGSFQSDQAVWATEYIKRNEIHFPYGCTTLCEIVYPENRIVVDYRGLETLIIHGVRDNNTGKYWHMEDIHDFFHNDVKVMKSIDLIDTFAFCSVEESIDFVNRQSGVELEGVVIVCEDGERFKVKGEDYLRLHRLVTDISPKRVWELLCAGNYEDYRKQIPDEFIKEFDEYAKEIMDWHEDLMVKLMAEYNMRPITETQKDYALWVQTREPWMSPYLFKMNKGIEVSHFLLTKWKDMTGYVGR